MYNLCSLFDYLLHRHDNDVESHGDFLTEYKYVFNYILCFLVSTGQLIQPVCQYK